MGASLSLSNSGSIPDRGHWEEPCLDNWITSILACLFYILGIMQNTMIDRTDDTLALIPPEQRRNNSEDKCLESSIIWRNGHVDISPARNRGIGFEGDRERENMSALVTGGAFIIE